ncbi:MAG: EamA family transporter, partial [Sphaerospermopsis sp. SIO1G2]|nr:EamA family transporter [Sphaerospermopsis sp. SIO1G2]
MQAQNPAPQDRTSARRQAFAMMIVAAVMFSLGGVFIKLSTWDALPLNGARSAVSGLIMALYVYRQKGAHWPRFNRNMLLGAVAYTLTNLTFMQATKLTTAANAVVLQFI